MHTRKNKHVNGQVSSVEMDPRDVLPHRHRAIDTIAYDTIRYDTRGYFNVRSKANTSQLNLPHGTDN